MNSKEFRSLAEAYAQVYAPQEVDEVTAMAKRGYDETKLRKRAGGGEAADRATALEKKPTYGDAKKAKQRSEYARKQRGDFRNTASSSPGLHGYGYQSNDPKVKAKQAARGAQRGALTPNEKKQLNMEMEYDIFDVVLEFLYVEGYAETLEDAEWMMANVIDEEAIGIILGEAITSEKGKAKAAEMIAKRSTPSGRAKSGKGADVATIKHIGRSEREGLGGTPMTPTMARNPAKSRTSSGTGNKAARRAGLTPTREKPNAWKEEFESWLDEAMTNYEKNRKRAAQRAAARNAARDQGKTGAVPGVGYVTPRRERETWTDESGKTRHAKGL